MVEGSLDLTTMRTMLKEYLTVENSPELKQAVEHRKTMSLVMENADSGFSFSVESDELVMALFLLFFQLEFLKRIKYPHFFITSAMGFLTVCSYFLIQLSYLKNFLKRIRSSETIHTNSLPQYHVREDCPGHGRRSTRDRDGGRCVRFHLETERR